MTKKELEQLYYLNKETERLQNQVLELIHCCEYKSPVITGLPSGSFTSDNVSKYAIEIAELKNIISANLSRIFYERRKIEEYIANIEDSEIRLIMRLRHINGMTWEQIGYEINMDRRTVSRKYNKFIKDAHNAR